MQRSPNLKWKKWGRGLDFKAVLAFPIHSCWQLTGRSNWDVDKTVIKRMLHTSITLNESSTSKHRTARRFVVFRLQEYICFYMPVFASACVNVFVCVPLRLIPTVIACVIFKAIILFFRWRQSILHYPDWHGAHSDKSSNGTEIISQHWDKFSDFSLCVFAQLA